MSEKKVKDRLNNLVNKMAQNSFLMPDAFSDVIDLQANDYSYKTYVGNRCLSSRYVIIYITLEGEDIIEVVFSRNEDIIIKKSIDVVFSLAKFLKLIELIYEEKHSFSNHNEGSRKLRKSIREAKEKIKNIEKEIQSYKDQLEGLKNLSNQNK